MQPQIPPAQLNAPQTQNQPLQFPPLQNPQRPTQLLVQPIDNPNNNKIAQPIYNTEIQSLPTYFITPVPLLGVQLRSGRSLQPKPPTVIIEEHEEEQQYDEDLGGKEKKMISRNQLIIQTGKFQAPKTPPYPERLTIEKPVVSP
jgi:hypothetical protein